MKTTLLTAAALLSVLSSFASRETELRFAPKEGLVLTKVASFSTDVTMDDLSVSVNGESMDVETPDVRNAVEGRLEVTDTYVGVDGDRVTKLERRFDAGTRESISESPEGDTAEDDESALNGLSVVFTWDEDAEEYDVAFAESDEGEDEDLLEDLDWDLDFADLLPSGAVEEGDSWDAEAALRVIMSLGGDLKFDDEEDSPAEALIGEAMEENLEGEVTCTFTGVREEGGRKVAVIGITIEAAGEAEGDGDEETADLEIEVELTRKAETTLELEGEFLWDIEAGHFVSLSLSGDITLSLTELTVADVNGRDFEQELVIVFAGELSLEVTAEPAE